MSDESKEDITPDITSFLQDVILSDIFLLFRKKKYVAFAVTGVYLPFCEVSSPGL